MTWLLSKDILIVIDVIDSPETPPTCVLTMGARAVLTLLLGACVCFASRSRTEAAHAFALPTDRKLRLGLGRGLEPEVGLSSFLFERRFDSGLTLCRRVEDKMRAIGGCLAIPCWPSFGPLGGAPITCDQRELASADLEDQSMRFAQADVDHALPVSLGCPGHFSRTSCPWLSHNVRAHMHLQFAFIALSNKVVKRKDPVARKYVVESNDDMAVLQCEGPVSMAKRAKVPIVPVTILGTGRLMPSKKEFFLYHNRAGVQVIVHPAVSAEEVQETPDKEVLLNLRNTIESALPLELQKGTVASCGPQVLQGQAAMDGPEGGLFTVECKRSIDADRYFYNLPCNGSYSISGLALVPPLPWQTRSGIPGEYKLDTEEDETEEPEFVPLPPPPKGRTQRQSVSAEAFGEWNQRVIFEPAVYPKTPDQTQELVEVTAQSFLFTSLEEKDLRVVIAAMKGPLILESGHRIIQEGDTGDHLYVVTDGSMDCVKVIDGVEMVVKTCVKGDLFGELALLYNCPRAASVQCREPAVLWELDRATFNNIVMEGVQRKRNQCLSVLSSVPLFSSITRGELENIIDALKMERRPRGDVIISQGEVGDHFYIVYEGQVMASKITEESPEPVMMIHE
ncbi:PKAR, partial [Symbiodinium sp. KB8]